MPITRARKEEIVAVLTAEFGKAQSAVFVDFTGLSVAQMQTIRRKMLDEGCYFMVAKNTLIRLALDNVGLSLVDSGGVSHDALCEGVTAVAFGYERPSAAAQVLLDLQKDLDAITFKGGFFGRTPVSGDAGVKRISQMRSKEDALADVVRILKGAPSRVRLVAAAAPQKVIALKRLLESENAA